MGVDIGTTFWRTALQLIMPSLKNVRALPPFSICRKYHCDGAERRRYKGVHHRIVRNSLFGRPITKMVPVPHTLLYPLPMSFCSLSSKRWSWSLHPLNLDWPLTRSGQWNMVEVILGQLQVLASRALVCSHLLSWTPATNTRTSPGQFAAGWETTWKRRESSQATPS